MKSKEDVIKKLREDPLFQQALSMAKDDQERQAIVSMVEGMVGHFADVLVPAAIRAEKDPAFVEELKRALHNNELVVTDNEPATSGSR